MRYMMQMVKSLCVILLAFSLHMPRAFSQEPDEFDQMQEAYRMMSVLSMIDFSTWVKENINPEVLTQLALFPPPSKVTEKNIGNYFFLIDPTSFSFVFGSQDLPRNILNTLNDKNMEALATLKLKLASAAVLFHLDEDLHVLRHRLLEANKRISQKFFQVLPEEKIVLIDLWAATSDAQFVRLNTQLIRSIYAKYMIGLAYKLSAFTLLYDLSGGSSNPRYTCRDFSMKGSDGKAYEVQDFASRPWLILDETRFKHEDLERLWSYAKNSSQNVRQEVHCPLEEDLTSYYVSSKLSSQLQLIFLKILEYQFMFESASTASARIKVYNRFCEQFGCEKIASPHYKLPE